MSAHPEDDGDAPLPLPPACSLIPPLAHDASKGLSHRRARLGRRVRYRVLLLLSRDGDGSPAVSPPDPPPEAPPPPLPGERYGSDDDDDDDADVASAVAAILTTFPVPPSAGDVAEITFPPLSGAATWVRVSRTPAVRRHTDDEPPAITARNDTQARNRDDPRSAPSLLSARPLA